jgi:hypothetical protein
MVVALGELPLRKQLATAYKFSPRREECAHAAYSKSWKPTLNNGAERKRDLSWRGRDRIDRACEP